MNAHPHRFQGYPDLTPETIGKAFRDGRAYRSAEQLCRNAPDLHETRHVRIGDDVVRFTLPDAIITAAIAVLIGMIVAGAF